MKDTKQVKVLTAPTYDEVMNKYIEFEKQHTVIDLKQPTPTTIFVFYDDTIVTKEIKEEDVEQYTFGGILDGQGETRYRTRRRNY